MAKVLRIIFQKKTGLPSFIENDSSIVALAELRFGAARSRTNAMVINIGWGRGPRNDNRCSVISWRKWICR